MARASNVIAVEGEKVIERRAWQLLRRYGVMFRDLLARESYAPSWRSLLAVYRRLEARGEIRGGRFVNGFVGEQFALPEAVEAARGASFQRSRRAGLDLERRSAEPGRHPDTWRADFTCLNQVIAYRKGMPVDVGLLGAVLSRLQQ